MADSLLSPLPEQGISPLQEQLPEQGISTLAEQGLEGAEQGIEKAEPKETEWRLNVNEIQRPESNEWPKQCLNVAGISTLAEQGLEGAEQGIEKAEPKETEWRLNVNEIQRPESNEWPKQCLNVAERGIEEAESSNRPSPLLEHRIEMPSEENAWRLNFSRISRPEMKEMPKCCSIVSGPFGGDGVAKYYQQQGEMLDGFAEMDLVTDNCALPGMSKEDSDKLARSETIAIVISNIANVVLFIANLYASIKSGSLAIIASTLDSILDLLSGFILLFTAFKMKSENPYRYPIGKKRMQPLGVIIFASAMATLGMGILLESIQRLVSKEHNLSLEGGGWLWVVGLIVFDTVVKFVLVIYCRSFTNDIVKAYAQGHLFDVMTNAIGLVAAILARQLYWWIDPVGAIVLALYTMSTWMKTVLENVNSLVGKSASPDYLQKLTYLCWNHHQAIQNIDTVKAYTIGSHYFVEVDIVLPSDMPLQEAHDVGEALQEKLESLPDIGRAYVHLDYECRHKPEHRKN